MLKKAVRVVCTGSSGGGKTTLIKALSEKYGREGTIFSRPTAAARIMGYEAARYVKPSQMMEFQWLSLIQQISAEQEVDYFLGDRGVIDFAAYALYQVPRHELDHSYINIVYKYAMKYDAIIFTPSPEVVEDNGIRHTHGVIEVENNVKKLIKEFSLEDKIIWLDLDNIKNPDTEMLNNLVNKRMSIVENELRLRGLKL